MRTAVPLLVVVLASCAAGAAVRPSEKKLEDLDADDANDLPKTLNDDAPPAVARVNFTGDIEDVLAASAADTASHDDAAAEPSIITAAQPHPPSASLYLTTKRPSHLHHVESLLGLVGLRDQVSAVVTVASLLAYAHLLSLTSRSRFFIMEAVQVIACACFPTLPLVQLLHNSIRTVVRTAKGGAAAVEGAVAFGAACVAGQYAIHPESKMTALFDTRRRLVEVDARDTQLVRRSRSNPVWLLRTALMVASLLAGATAMHIYFDHPTRSDWDAAAIGRDNRSGWLALAGILSALLSLAVHVGDESWTLQADSTAEEPISVLWESEVFTEIALAALLQDGVAAWAGASSLIGTALVFAANRVVLVLVFVVAVVLNRNLRLFAGGLTGPQRRYRSLRAPAVAFSIAICACILLFQACSAFLEQDEYYAEPWMPDK